MALSPNVDVPGMEITAFDILKMVYLSFGRKGLIEAVDDPNHIFDDRLLAMADAAAGLIEPYQG